MTPERKAMTLERQAFEDWYAARQDLWGYPREILRQAWHGALVANLSRAAEPVGWLSDEDIADLQTNRTDEEGVDAIECFLWREQAHEQLRAIYAHSPEPARDAKKWRQGWIDERAHRYRAEGMKIEQARIHAETDATRAAIAMAQESGDGK